MLAQCVLALWRPVGGFEARKDAQPGVNALVHVIVEADSSQRCDLYLLPVGRKPLLTRHATDADADAPLQHTLAWHLRKDEEHAFPYRLFRERHHDEQRRRRWKQEDAQEPQEQEHKAKAKVDEAKEKRESRSLEDKVRVDDEDYAWQVREQRDVSLAVEWLKNALVLFACGHVSAQLHLASCHLQLKAWELALRHAEHTLTLHRKQQQQQQQAAKGKGKGAAGSASHTTYLAHMYAAEALVHLSRFNAAIKHLNPLNFPHLAPPAVAAADKKEAEEVHAAEEQKTKEAEAEREQYLAVVNLATTWICKNALDKAHKYIHKALTVNDQYAPALRMLVYPQVPKTHSRQAADAGQ